MSKLIEFDENKNISAINKVILCSCGNPLFIEKLIDKCSFIDGVSNCVNNGANNE